jgi:hypothetical protein
MELQGLNDLLHETNPRLIEREIIDFINKMKKKARTGGQFTTMLV